MAVLLSSEVYSRVSAGTGNILGDETLLLARTSSSRSGCAAGEGYTPGSEIVMIFGVVASGE